MTMIFIRNFYIDYNLWLIVVEFENRAVFAVGGELQRGLQDCGVEHSDGGGSDGDIVVPDAVVPLHATSGAGGDHCGGDARPHRLRGGDAFVARGQIRLPRVHGRLRRRRLRQHSNRTHARGN